MNRVDTVIAEVQKKYPASATPSRVLAYYEAVHQELAPLARALEAETVTLKGRITALEARIAELDPKVRLFEPVKRYLYTCEHGHTYISGQNNVTLFAERGAAWCRVCYPTCRLPDDAKPMSRSAI